MSIILHSLRLCRGYTKAATPLRLLATVKNLVVAVKRNDVARERNTVGNKCDKHWNRRESQRNFTLCSKFCCDSWQFVADCVAFPLQNRYVLQQQPGF